ncbi:MAG TPA: alpha/beta fold hydrolase [Thermoleophilaceae bacterium]|nr:alpha/beta fold hydrolase [Thermoleophilaceae bacterium]
MRRIAPLAAALAVLVLPAAAGAAPPLKPFGHVCKEENFVRFCETKNDAQRVRSFDGVPLDVDVTLPATGDGPFPTLMLMHGYGGSKTNFESTDPVGDGAVTFHYNNNYFARQGYAVVTPSARGFGRSCGAADSRTSPECDRGWIHFADQRFELHDVQYMLGLLADQGVTDPLRIGVSGVSYGGLQSAQLAFMRDKVRTRDGRFVLWRSPKGKLMRIAASWVRWASGELIYSLIPNGRLLSTGSHVPSRPFGVEKESLLNALYVGGAVTGFLAPAGADPTADLETWRATANQGEPYGPAAAGFVEQFRTFKGAFRLAGAPTPLMIQNGWTDPVFPGQDALRLYNRAREEGDPDTPVILQLGDIGHFTGGDPPGQYARFNDDGAEFLMRHVRGEGGGILGGSVTVFGQGCPKGQLGIGPINARSYGALARGSFRLGFDKARTLTSAGGDSVDTAVDPVAHESRCERIAAERGKGDVVTTRRSEGFTQVGLPTVRARVRTTGRFGQIVARLWDVAGGKQRIVDFGVYRLTPNQKGEVVLQMQGNAYRFRKGHAVKLELVGSSDPLYRASNGQFKVELSDVHASIPTRERPSRGLHVSKRTKLR